MERPMHQAGIDVYADKKRRKPGLFFLISLIIANICTISSGICEPWTDSEVRLLPDSSFAMIETDGKEIKIRHLPHHDSNGILDEEQLIFSLGTLGNEIWKDVEHREKARRHLEKHYEKLQQRIMKDELPKSININHAGLTKLVMLPHVGPVLAVKILKYREKNGRFDAIEDLMKIEGIGQGTFNAVKHYIAIR